MTKMKRLLRNKKALSPVLSTILMIVIVVIGMTIAFGFFVNYVRDFQAGRGSSVLELLAVEDVWFKSTTTSQPSPHRPASDNLLGGTTRLVPWTPSYLVSSNDQYMTYRSYGTAFTPLVSDYVDQLSNEDGNADKGTHTDFSAQQSYNEGTYDTLTEAVSGTTGDRYYPLGYNLLGQTSFISGSTSNLVSNDGVYMQFRSYPSQYGTASTFGYTTKGGTTDTLDRIRSSRFTCTSAGTATSISAYLTNPFSTFGRTSTGSGTGQSIEDTIRGERFTTPSNPVVAQNIIAYIYCSNTAKNMKAAIYDNSGNKIADSNELLVPTDSSSQWRTFTFASPPTLSASTNYVLVVWSQAGSGNAELRYSSTSGGNGRYSGQTYGSWPSSVSFTTNSYQYCIYCTCYSTFQAKAAIYSGDGSTFIASTQEKTLSSIDGWVTFDFSTSSTLSASTQYVLVVWASDGNILVNYDTGTARYFRGSSGATYPTWPSSVSDQGSSRTYSIYCTYASPSEYTCEIEFTGSSDTDPWTQLDWTVDSAWTTTSVPTTLQLYNYNLNTYPTSGDGYISYTSSSTQNTDELKPNSITINPTYFRDASGNWKLKIKGVKTTSAQFDCRVDLVEYKATKNNYALDLEEQWTSAVFDETDEYLCIYTGTPDGSENLKVDVWTGSTWTTVIPALLPNQWNNVSVSSWLMGNTFTIRFKDGTDTRDKTQSNWQIDCALLYTGYTPTEYTCEVEFTGSSDSLNWNGLNWTTECGWTVDEVDVTIQLYDWTADSYPQSGDGYVNFNSRTANIDQTNSLSITTDPARFKNPIDQSWKVKIKGVKSTSTLFDLNVDWIELYPQAREGYPIEMWLYSYGKIDTMVSSVYVNGLSVDFTPATIKIGEHSKIIISLSTQWTPGTAYKIKLVTERGSVFEGEYVSPVTG